MGAIFVLVICQVMPRLLTPRPEVPVSLNRARWAVALISFLPGLLFASPIFPFGRWALWRGCL